MRLTEGMPNGECRMKYWRIDADDSGESRLAVVDTDFSGTAHTPPAPPVDVAAPVEVTKHVMMRVPMGWKGDLHRAPRRQLLVMLSGGISVEASSGPSLDLGPGDLLLLEDTVGKGHRTENTGDEPAFLMMVHLK